MSNAELIERLKGNDVILVLSIRAQAADALEAADKRIAELEAKIDEAYKKGYATGEEESERRIAELEAAIVAWKADQKENMAIAVEECKRANEAERKLAVAREALEKYGRHDKNCEAVTEAVSECCGCGLDESLAQIGGDDAAS